MNSTLVSSADDEARLLILIDTFSGSDLNDALQGRMKLAKLDFLLRYPDRLKTLLKARDVQADLSDDPWLTGAIEQRMIRYRYGPWDPSYYTLLGALTGKQLIQPLHTKAGAAYQATRRGRQVSVELAKTSSWKPVKDRTRVLRRYLNLSGPKLKDIIYETFPDIVEAELGTPL